ncbi:LuxR C-terminal-related transcriptional regulator [Kitasatospora sp. NPDC101183]|uniref:helix-turn-helix transcriptional regulator n=1 Tax=Kitasatospora sp. NPDC101183 TaxID=3364100 RepID=UPI00382EA00F
MRAGPGTSDGQGRAGGALAPGVPAQDQELGGDLVEAALKLALAQLAKQQSQEKEAPAVAAGEPATHGVVHLHGLPEINRSIQTALEDAEREILTAQPDGPRPGLVLDGALESVRRQIAGGVAMRTLYQHTTRFDEATKGYVRTVTDHGVQVRTLAEFFDRLIVIDRSTAFISANEDRTVASMITEPSVVRFLSDVFERSWDRAEPFPFVPIHAAQAAPEVVPAIRESIRRLLVEGHSDKVIARRLGISERSLQAHVAAIKDGLGAKNRLHLGYLLGRGETTLVL